MFRAVSHFTIHTQTTALQLDTITHKRGVNLLRDSAFSAILRGVFNNENTIMAISAIDMQW
jgi:hypothetical protein